MEGTGGTVNSPHISPPYRPAKGGGTKMNDFGFKWG